MPRVKETSPINGGTLRVVGLGDPDYANQLVISTLPDGRTIFTSGLSLDILFLLEKTLNFSHIAIRGEGWPNRLENGSWTGISRQIMDNEADLSIAQTAFIDIRIRDFDFLIPTTLGYLAASFKQPASNSLKNLLAASFGLDLWVALLIFACLVVILIKIIRWIRIKFANSIWDWDENENRIRWDLLHAEEAAYWVLVTFCQRTFVGSPKSTPMRIIYISLTITSLVAYVALSATLISTMSIELVPITKFADLITSKLEPYGDVAAPFTHRFVESMVDTKRKFEGRSERTKNLSSSRFLDVQSGILKTLSEPAIYVTFDGVSFITYRKFGLSNEYMCGNKLSFFPVPLSSLAAGLFVRKGSFLRRIFNPKIVLFHQHGFIKRLRAKWSSDAAPKCGRTHKFHWTEPMDLKDVHTPITILIGGFVVSIVLLALEFNFRWFFVGYTIPFKYY